MQSLTPGRLARDELLDLIRSGDIDTIILAITDMQGRLQGKRLDATYFADEIGDAPVEGCSYMLASDVDMRTVDGFALTSWDRGYGDLAFQPDFSTIRSVPWHDKTAIIFADVETVVGEPVAPSPRQILQQQVSRHRHRARVHSLQRHVRAGVDVRVSQHDAGQPVQRGLLNTRDFAGRAPAGSDSPVNARRGHGGRVCEG